MSLSFEDEMMDGIARGCSKSFAALFEAYGSILLGYANKFLKNQATAEDITQEVWVKIAKVAPQYQAQGQFKAWVFTMTRNMCFNKLKADKRLQFKEDMTELSELAEPSITAEDKMLSDAKMGQVNEILSELPENQKVCLLLVTVEGLSYEEVANCLSISLGATKSLIHRARKTLNERLGDQNPANHNYSKPRKEVL